MAGKIKRKTRRTKAEWQALIEKFEQSGLDAEQFCQQVRIPSHRFHWWQARLSKQGSTAPFIELSPPQAAPLWDVELELGGAVILRLRRC
ncbi:MAG: hypothetical protein GY927_21435 [bacterium]|nr:hypothetical protein [bacterium]